MLMGRLTREGFLAMEPSKRHSNDLVDKANKSQNINGCENSGDSRATSKCQYINGYESNGASLATGAPP
jgi:hypothetical protein